MRSKKLRTSCDNDATWSQREGASCSGPCHTCKLHITALPTDVLANVFRYCPYEDVALQLRPVCRRFCDVATMVLNSGFSTMGPKIYRAMEAVQLSVTSAPTDTCLTALSGAFSLLEVLELQYRLLRAVTWRYVYNPFDSAPLACFYAGSILDLYLRLLAFVHHSPNIAGTVFYYCKGCRSYFSQLCNLCERFMDHFENVTESKLNVDYSVSGAKLVDLLDCLAEYDESVKPYRHAVTVNKTECHIKAHYRMRRSWFTHLTTMQFNREHMWKDKQRFMYVSLRRLVFSSNKNFLERVHHRRQLLFQDPVMPKPKRPEDCTFTGYDECGGLLIWYGNMNKAAFRSMLHAEANHNYEFSDADSLPSDDESGVESGLNSPNMDLQFDVEVQCPLDLAPLQYLENFESPDFEYRYSRVMKSADPLLSARDSESEFFLYMTVHCPASFTSGLPSLFGWLIRSCDFHKTIISAP